MGNTTARSATAKDHHLPEPSSGSRALLHDLLQRARILARQYYALTGRPLGITGELAEFEAARLLCLELAEVRQAGYDAIRRTQGTLEKLQIKGRCLRGASGRLGRIDLRKDWDAVLLVLLDEDLEAREIWEADRASVRTALEKPGSAARNVRGQLGVAQFKRIGHLVWAREASYQLACSTSEMRA